MQTCMIDYLPYNSPYSKHYKDNVSNDEKVEMRLKELQYWLKGCNYLDSVINQSFYVMQNYKVQTPV